MSFKKIVLGAMIALNVAILSAEQNSIGIDINSEDLEILGSVNLTQLSYYGNGTSYFADFSYLRSNSENLAALGISGKNLIHGVENLSLAFGFKSIFADNFFALPLFAKVTYEPPLNDQIPPTAFHMSFSYAPAVLTFADGSNYTEFRLQTDMEIISNINLFAGYRNIRTNYEKQDKTFNSSFYGGMRLSF